MEKGILEGRSKNLGKPWPGEALPGGRGTFRGLIKDQSARPKEGNPSVFSQEHLGVAAEAVGFLTLLFFEMRVSSGYAVPLSPISMGRAEDSCF